MKNNLKVVLDTNIILSSISSKSPYKIIFDKIFTGELDVFVTTDILLEYEEKIQQNFNKHLAEITIQSLEILDNVFYTDAHFQFKLIQNDEDDNKFVDCAIASNVHYLVSNDKHFTILKTIDFPKVNIIKMNEFIKLLNQ
jgi:putative PIN family toxin of toxin-antitoxin system